MIARYASLRHIRDGRKFSARDVASALGTSEARLAEFETGGAAPTSKQILRMAAIYGVEPYHLRTGSIPNLPPLPRDFRGANPDQASLSINGLKPFLFAERISAFISSIISSQIWSSPAGTLRVPVDQDASRLATAFVDKIGFDVGYFSSIKSPARAARYIRASLETSGVCILNSWDNHNDYRGFYYRYDNVLPLIMVHTRGWDVKSRLFTLLHEVGHYLIDVEGISDPFYSENSTEAFCNRFAARVLGPEEIISEAISHTATPRSDIHGFVRNVAAKTLLSQHATAIRLSELQVITDRQFSIWISSRQTFGDQKRGYATDGDPPDRAEQVLPRFGYLTALAIEQAVSSGSVSATDVFAATGIQPALQDALSKEASHQISQLGLAV